MTPKQITAGIDSLQNDDRSDINQSPGRLFHLIFSHNYFTFSRAPCLIMNEQFHCPQSKPEFCCTGDYFQINNNSELFQLKLIYWINSLRL